MRRQRAVPAGSSCYSVLTRFIFDKKHITKNPPKPKPGAFLPGPDLKTSAIGKDGLTEQQIWAIGLLVGEGREKSPKARADFGAEAVSSLKLTIEPDPLEGIPSHINLGGWPSEKDEQKSVAQELCVRAQLILPPSSL